MTSLPRVTSWRRWRKLSSLDYSLYRGLEYERLAGLPLPGLTLDLGGGRKTSYLHLLDVGGSLVSVNISPAVEPSALADLNHPLPFRDGVFDDVLTLNTLEHIYEDRLATAEIVRVLRPGGRFHIGVPFLYRVHGSPDDYSRHTASWWRRRMLELDVDDASLAIEPMVWDPLASAFSLVEFTRVRRLLKKPAMVPGLIDDRAARRKKSDAQDHANRNSDFALGYFITGRRRGDDAVVAPQRDRQSTTRARRVTVTAIRSVGRRLAEGVPLADRPARFLVRSMLDQRQLSSSRRASDFHYGSLAFSARPSDWNAVREVLIDGEYDIVDDLLQSETPTVVDLGANIGMFSLRVSSARPKAEVHAYEPDAATFQVLTENRTRNPQLRWCCFHAAAHASTGSVRFASAETSTAGRVSTAATAAEVDSVSLVDILGRCSTERIDLLKIDIEGSEEAVLGDDPSILARIESLIIEVHPDLVDASAVVGQLHAAFPYVHRIAGRASSKPLLVAARRQLDLPLDP